MEDKYYFSDGSVLDYLDATKTLHREGEPAIKYANGDMSWYFHGQLHRVDGPAIEWTGGTEWYLHGQLHRIDGPAVEHAKGAKQWYLNDKRINCDNQEMFERLLKLKAFW